MRNWIKTLIKISAIVLVVGLIIGTIGFALRGGKRFGISFQNGQLITSDELEVFTIEETVIDSFDTININVSNADVMIYPSTNDEYSIEYTIYSVEPEYEVSNGELTFTMDSNNVLETAEIGFKEESVVTIYVPKSALLENIVVDDSCGDVFIDGISFIDSELDLSCGDLRITNSTIDNLIHIKNSCGDVDFSDVSVSNIEADLSCGDMTIENTSVSESITADNSCGDVNISIDSELVSYNLSTSCGDIYINEVEYDEDSVNSNASLSVDGGISVEISDSCGDIELNY